LLEPPPAIVSPKPKTRNDGGENGNTHGISPKWH
jgi:hypothetical protein